MAAPDARSRSRASTVLDSRLESLERAHRAGVTLGLGTDLIGEAQPRQNEELAIRARVQPAVDVLRSMWTVNTQLCRLEGRIGVISPGAFGDIVISDVDPIDNITAFANHQTALTHVIHNGRVVVDRTMR